MAFLPDTNMFIAWTARGNRAVGDRIVAERGALFLSSIVLYELYSGAFKSDHIDRNLRAIEGLGIPPLPFDRADAEHAGRIRADLMRRGTPIGPYDTLIAGQALARGLVVVTANAREFARIDGLRIENWIAP